MNHGDEEKFFAVTSIMLPMMEQMFNKLKELGANHAEVSFSKVLDRIEFTVYSNDYDEDEQTKFDVFTATYKENKLNFKTKSFERNI